MKLAISNIGWEKRYDEEVYKIMKENCFQGLEIAPTRIFPENPYDHNIAARKWHAKLKRDYGFVIPSMQSIWYGRQERIFGTEEERQILVEYTKRAIVFASAIDCGNLVFGCPKNRNFKEGADIEEAVFFFREIGDYAAGHGTVIGMEANPPLYNTNYINDTISALDLIEKVDSEGFRLNLDVGTMIENHECVAELVDRVRLINHVHISEPALKPVEKRRIHNELKEILEEEDYQGFISIEMGRVNDIRLLEDIMEYVRSVFG